MICPHCGVAYKTSPEHFDLGEDKDGSFSITVSTCPQCDRYAIILNKRVQGGVGLAGGGFLSTWQDTDYVVWPLGSGRLSPPDVPASVAADFREASAVLPVSPKASAALSRRCLQSVLREEGRVRPRGLHDEIEEVLSRGDLPTYVSDVLHALRQFGNLAAHPETQKGTGEVIEVEVGEADWMLDALEAVFDHYYVKPAETRRRLEDLERKRHPDQLRQPDVLEEGQGDVIDR